MQVRCIHKLLITQKINRVILNGNGRIVGKQESFYKTNVLFNIIYNVKKIFHLTFMFLDMYFMFSDISESLKVLQACLKPITLLQTEILVIIITDSRAHTYIYLSTYFKVCFIS